MGFSLVGLRVSKVLPSTPAMNSLLMNLTGVREALEGGGGVAYKPRGCSYVTLGVLMVVESDMMKMGKGYH
jgi:hypothetical protein